MGKLAPQYFLAVCLGPIVDVFCGARELLLGFLGPYPEPRIVFSTVPATFR
jgi:hypothetical protein